MYSVATFWTWMSVWSWFLTHNTCYTVCVSSARNLIGYFKDWPVGIKFVQFQKNHSYHSGIKRTPYKAMFGVEAKVGLNIRLISRSLLHHLFFHKSHVQCCYILNMNERLKLVSDTQYMLHCMVYQYHMTKCAVKRTLYKVMFGVEAKVDLTPSSLPDVTTFIYFYKQDLDYYTFVQPFCMHIYLLHICFYHNNHI
jgi:hypothetical protein